MQYSYLYMLSNKFRGTLYIGVTSDIIKRMHEHRNGLCEGFAKKYDLKQLVWYAVYEDIREAIHRETQMKAWKRQWKIELIEKENPYWHDLHDTLF